MVTRLATFYKINKFNYEFDQPKEKLIKTVTYNYLTDWKLQHACIYLSQPVETQG